MPDQSGAIVKIVATDLDGTLLRSDLSIGERTLSALDRVRRRGVWVVPVTARQPGPVRQVIGAAGFDGWAVCANGALVEHLGSGEVAYAAELAAEAQARLVTGLQRLSPTACFAAIRDNGRRFCADPAYRQLLEDGDHGRPLREIEVLPRDELVTEPCIKLVVRDPVTPVVELEALVQGLGIADVVATRSGAPFVELAAAGVDKGSGLALLCRRLGVRPPEVVAFGDAPNDVAMLRWAGHGVAIGAGDPLAHAAADEVLPGSSDDEVLARWLERHLLDAPGL